VLTLCKNFAVLVSGGGTNLQAIIDAISDKKINSAKLVCVISNKENAYALERAKKAGIPTYVFTKKDHGKNFDCEILKCLKEYNVDFVVLAGFMAIIGKEFIRAYLNKIINVHPSLIPSFCGEGFYGLHVHEKALEYGVKITGATVHFVNEEVDGGAVILQKAVEVLEGDTPETLQKRVMEQAEWEILPGAIVLVASGRVSVLGRVAHIK